MYPQVAAVPFIVGGGASGVVLSKVSAIAANVLTTLGCALGGFLSFQGVSSSKIENQRAERELFAAKKGWKWFSYVPTEGELLTGTGVAAGGAVPAVTVNAYLRIIQKTIEPFVLRVTTATSGAIGFMCGVTGGVLGYFYNQSSVAEKNP